MSQDDVMQLVLRHRNRIWAYLMALARSPQRAEDLFQQTCLVICRKWDAFEPGSDFLGWALTIARYEFLASVDPKRRRELSNEADILAGAWTATPEESALQAARREALRPCLASLAGRARRALRHRYVDGLDGRESARRLGTTENALYAILSRARKALRACIERYLVREGLM